MTTQLSFNFSTPTDKAATIRQAGKDLAFVSSTKNGVALTKQQIHDLPALYTFAEGAQMRKATKPTAQPVDWGAMAEESALALEPVADDEMFAVKR